MKNDSSVLNKYNTQFTLIDPHAKELNLFDNLNALYVVYDYKPMEYLKANGLEQSEIYHWMADLKKANVTVRNFPATVAELRKRLHLTEGGDTYLFASTLNNGQKVIIRCEKV